MIDDFLKIHDPLQPGMVAVIGIPYDENSSFMRGAALAPARIREVLHAGSINLCAENGLDLSTSRNFLDLGDLDPGNGKQALEKISAVVSQLLNHDVKVLSLGGDHAITYPIIKAFNKKYGRLTILQFDAHPDLYDEYDGNRYSHACPFARIMEEKLAGRLIQIGVRAENPHQRLQANRFQVETVSMRNWSDSTDIDISGPVYISIDLDALDPAFAPGVSHHEPGGLSTRDILGVLHRIRAPIAGADIVEFNPKRDSADITAMVAVKFLKEIAGKMLEQGARNSERQ